MLNVVYLLILAGALLALRNWRWGIAAAILIGLLQDPLRKLIPGAPSYLVLASSPVWLATVISALFAGQLAPQRFIHSFPRLGLWILIFAAYLLIPAVISATYGHNTWQITLLGAFVYLTTFFVLLAGWRYPDRRHDIGRFLVFYGILAGVFLIGGPLEFLGLQERFAFIGTESLGHLWVTHRTGRAVHMLSGFFRSPDVMGWHATLVFMVSVIMAFRSRGAARGAWIGMAVWGVLNIWLCGRRKMLAMVPVFMGTYLVLVFRFKNVRRIVSIAATALMIGSLGWYFISSWVHDEAVEAFYLTTLTEAESRVQFHGVDTVVHTVRQAGFWGYGLGMSQQGVHNIQADKPRLWQESGPGKMVAELGVPGAVLLLALGVILFLTAYQVLRLGRRDTSFYYSAGIFSILAANLTSAVVSAQIFGDPLVALLLAFMIGLLLSTARSRPDAEAAAVPAVAPQAATVRRTPNRDQGTSTAQRSIRSGQSPTLQDP